MNQLVPGNSGSADADFVTTIPYCHRVRRNVIITKGQAWIVYSQMRRLSRHAASAGRHAVAAAAGIVSVYRRDLSAPGYLDIVYMHIISSSVQLITIGQLVISAKWRLLTISIVAFTLSGRVITTGVHTLWKRVRSAGFIGISTYST